MVPKHAVYVGTVIVISLVFESVSELVVRAEQQCFLVAAAVGAAQRFAAALLCVLLIRRREVMDGVLQHVARIHRLLQTAGDAHGSTMT